MTHSGGRHTQPQHFVLWHLDTHMCCGMWGPLHMKQVNKNQTNNSAGPQLSRPSVCLAWVRRSQVRPQLDMVLHTYNPSSQEVETGIRSFRVTRACMRVSVCVFFFF